MRQAKRYITAFEIKKQIHILYKCYCDRMIEEYKELSQMIINYDKSFTSWAKMLSCKDFDFKSISLNCIVKIKILLLRL